MMFLYKCSGSLWRAHNDTADTLREDMSSTTMVCATPRWLHRKHAICRSCLCDKSNAGQKILILVLPTFVLVAFANKKWFTLFLDREGAFELQWGPHSF